MFSQIRTLHKEHSNFAKLLDLLEARLSSNQPGEDTDYALMLDVMEYMTHFPDRFHHPREDLAFRRLQRRRPQMRSAVRGTGAPARGNRRQWLTPRRAA